MKTPYLDKMIDDLQNHIESVEVASYAGIPETRAELAEYETIKERLSLYSAEQQNEDLLPFGRYLLEHSNINDGKTAQDYLQDFLKQHPVTKQTSVDSEPIASTYRGG